jgi:hypothetical protein
VAAFSCGVFFAGASAHGAGVEGVGPRWIGDAHADVDKAVIEALRQWLAVTAHAALNAMAEEERATSALNNNLGRLYQQQGKYALAETLFTEALTGRRSKLGGDHPRTLISMSNLGNLYKQKASTRRPRCFTPRVSQRSAGSWATTIQTRSPR